MSNEQERLMAQAQAAERITALKAQAEQEAAQRMAVDKAKVAFGVLASLVADYTKELEAAGMSRAEAVSLAAAAQAQFMMMAAPK